MRNLVKVLALAATMAMSYEGLRQIPYLDPPGVLTTCWGSTSDVIPGRKYSLEECKDRLDKDMVHAINLVERCQPGLPDNVLAAFSDAVFNMGPTIACNTEKSTAARLLKAKDYPAACNQLPRWNTARIAGVPVVLPGLVKRREAERQLCLG